MHRKYLKKSTVAVFVKIVYDKTAAIYARSGIGGTPGTCPHKAGDLIFVRRPYKIRVDKRKIPEKMSCILEKHLIL